MNHMMIDIETLGTAPGSVILSIGAVMFGPGGLGAEFYSRVDATSCVQAGLKIDPSTVAWWMQQNDAARTEVFAAGAPYLNVALLHLAGWCKDQEIAQVWCHGATFDVPLLEAAYRAAYLESMIPWKFYNARCTRTLYELASVSPDRSQGVHHNALNDAKVQALAAVKAHQVLGVWS